MTFNVKAKKQGGLKHLHSTVKIFPKTSVIIAFPL